MKLLKLQATWCGPCKNLGQWMETITLPYEVEEIDIDEDTNAASKYGVRGIPAIVLVDDKEEKVEAAVGFDPAKEMLQKLVVH